jgi:hypothetical protein
MVKLDSEQQRKFQFPAALSKENSSCAANLIG